MDAKQLEQAIGHAQELASLLHADETTFHQLAGDLNVLRDELMDKLYAVDVTAWTRAHDALTS